MRPDKLVGCGTVNLFTSDVDFLQSKGVEPRDVVTESLHLYCDSWRSSQWLSRMTKEKRDQFVLYGMKGLSRRHPKLSPYTFELVGKIPAMAMRDWSKYQRDVYILFGTVP